MADTVTDQLVTLNLSYLELNEMEFNPQFIEDYLNQISNIFLVSESTDVDREQIETNTTNIGTNTTNIGLNTTAIGVNAGNITTNTTNIGTNTTNIGTNTTAISLASGQLVGNNDYATALIGGVVNLMALVADAAASTAEITIADIGAAPVAYDQTYTDSVTTLLNDTKSKHNQLLLDLNAAIVQLNELIANSKTAKQMALV